MIMIDIKMINESLSNIRAKGINLPSAQPMYQAFFGDVFTKKGLIRSRAPKRRLKMIAEGFPELINERIIVESEYQRIERMVNNFNKHAKPNDRINVNVRSLSVTNLFKVKYEIATREMISNIYMPEFGMLLRDIIEDAQDDGREI